MPQSREPSTPASTSPPPRPARGLRVLLLGAVAAGAASAWLSLDAPAALAPLAAGVAALGGAVAGWAVGRRGALRDAARSEARGERDRRLLRETAARAFRAQETERMRIARELQEETAQTLSALLLHLQVARTLPDPEARAEVLEQIRGGLVEATDTVRRFARGLYPPALNDVGLVAAVQAYADTLSERGGPRITVSADDVQGLLSRDRELSLYRVLQEALANAVRHAGAAAVEVRIARDGRWVRATVEDDGVGFDLAAREADHPCLGLFGLRERALYAGGTASVESAPGTGTRVRVELPLEAGVRVPGLTIVPRPVAAGQ
jgi:signal transduction histidine kinase